MSAAVTVREAQPGDLEAVVTIERRAYAHPWSPELLARELTTAWSTMLVAEAEGGPAGFAVVWNVAGEVSLLDLAVDPGHRRRGIARALLNALFERARVDGARTFTLEVRRSNVGARTLYETMGFVQTGLRPGYYAPEHEDAIIMERTL